jgi:serine O-acetyltransferase
MKSLITIFSLIKSDLYRYSGDISLKSFIRNYFFTPGFNYTVWYRLSSIDNILIRFMLFRKQIRFGIHISHDTNIDAGLYIGHFGGIVVNTRAVIGKNCNISQGVTIGQLNTGSKRGYPTIGDNVYIAPGAKILGNINIGNNVAIGANSVVTNDIPDCAVVVGIPARVVSLEGSTGYINRTVNN